MLKIYHEPPPAFNPEPIPTILKTLMGWTKVELERNPRNPILDLLLGLHCTTARLANAYRKEAENSTNSFTKAV